MPSGEYHSNDKWFCFIQHLFGSKKNYTANTACFTFEDMLSVSAKYLVDIKSGRMPFICRSYHSDANTNDK